ncbi:MAG: hypothetical protein KF893_05810 [Caldilineaceae bacterium]|nr:hypothetical protein [Caldilineaceae bacterium]
MGTTLAVVALALALAGLVYAWTVSQGLAQATRRLDRYNRALFDASEEIRRLREEHAQQLATLHGEVARLSGKAAFSPNMTMREIYALHPQAEEVLARFHIGGCSSCAADLDDRLDQLCRASGLDVEHVVGSLNGLFGSNRNGVHNGEIQRVKLPNIEFNV